MKIIGEGFFEGNCEARSLAASRALKDFKGTHGTPPLDREDHFIFGYVRGHAQAVEHLRDAIRLARAVETLASDDRWVTLAGKGVIVRAGKDCKPEGLIYAKPTLLDALERAAAAVNEGGAT